LSRNWPEGVCFEVSVVVVVVDDDDDDTIDCAAEVLYSYHNR
jgi:hypothetical protein